METVKVLVVLAEELKVDVEEFRKHRRNSVLRGIAAKLLIRYSGLTQREVAGVLGLATGASISVQMRRAGAELVENRGLNSQVDKAMNRLATLREDNKSKEHSNAYFKG